MVATEAILLPPWSTLSLEVWSLEVSTEQRTPASLTLWKPASTTFPATDHHALKEAELQSALTNAFPNTLTRPTKTTKSTDTKLTLSPTTSRRSSRKSCTTDPLKPHSLFILTSRRTSLVFTDTLLAASLAAMLSRLSAGERKMA